MRILLHEYIQSEVIMVQNSVKDVIMAYRKQKLIYHQVYRQLVD